MKTLEIDEDTAEKICKNISYVFPNLNIIYRDVENWGNIYLNHHILGYINTYKICNTYNFRTFLTFVINELLKSNAISDFCIEQALINIDLKSL